MHGLELSSQLQAVLIRQTRGTVIIFQSTTLGIFYAEARHFLYLSLSLIWKALTSNEYVGYRLSEFMVHAQLSVYKIISSCIMQFCDLLRYLCFLYAKASVHSCISIVSVWAGARSVFQTLCVIFLETRARKFSRPAVRTTSPTKGKGQYTEYTVQAMHADLNYLSRLIFIIIIKYIATLVKTFSL